MSFSDIRLSINDGWKNTVVEGSFTFHGRLQGAARCPIVIGMGQI